MRLPAALCKIQRKKRETDGFSKSTLMPPPGSHPTSGFEARQGLPKFFRHKKRRIVQNDAANWWSEATQIRTIALWGIFGGNFIESDGFCAVFVVECNQNFFIIEINRVHERVDKRLPVAFHVRVELAEPGQPETNLIFA